MAAAFVVQIAQPVGKLHAAILAQQRTVGTKKRRRHGTRWDHKRLHNERAENEGKNQGDHDRLDRLLDPLGVVDLHGFSLWCRGHIPSKCFSRHAMTVPHA